MHGSHAHYDSPVVTDYGDLRRITASFQPLAAASDLGFSSPNNTPGPGGGTLPDSRVDPIPTGPGGGPNGPAGTITEPIADGAPNGGAGDVGDGNDSGGDSGGGSGGDGGGGAGAGSGGGGSGGGDGGSLPFTGFAAGAAAAIGSALAAGGTALRRATRRGR